MYYLLDLSKISWFHYWDEKQG